MYSQNKIVVKCDIKLLQMVQFTTAGKQCRDIQISVYTSEVTYVCLRDCVGYVCMYLGSNVLVYWFDCDVQGIHLNYCYYYYYYYYCYYYYS